MTETKEQELKPCSFCGSTDIYIDASSDIRAVVHCDNCTANISGGDVEAACAAWNRRAVQKRPKGWSKEPPTETGLYWIPYGTPHRRNVVMVRVLQMRPLYGHDPLHVESVAGYGLAMNARPLDAFIKDSPWMRWLKLVPPPLPEERREA